MRIFVFYSVLLFALLLSGCAGAPKIDVDSIESDEPVSFTDPAFLGFSLMAEGKLSLMHLNRYNEKGYDNVQVLFRDLLWGEVRTLGDVYKLRDGDGGYLDAAIQQLAMDLCDMIQQKSAEEVFTPYVSGYKLYSTLGALNTLLPEGDIARRDYIASLCPDVDLSGYPILPIGSPEMDHLLTILADASWHKSLLDVREEDLPGLLLQNAKTQLRNAAVYQLLHDPSLELFNYPASIEFATGLVVNTWQKLSADVQNELLSDYVINVWWHKWADIINTLSDVEEASE